MDGIKSVTATFSDFTAYDVVFRSNRSGNWEIWKTSLTYPTHMVQMSNFNGSIDPSEPKWSPNGKWIAFSAVPQGESLLQVYIINSDGNQAPVRLTTITGNYATHARFGADSDWVYFDNIAPATNGIISRVSRTTLVVETVQGDTSKTVQSFDISKDGKFRLEMREDGCCWTPNMYTAVYDLVNGTSATILPTDGNAEWYGKFNLDNTKIVYAQSAGYQNPTNLWTMNVDGTNRQQLTAATGNESYSISSWLYDNTNVLVMYNNGSDDDIIMINTKTGQQQAFLQDTVYQDGQPDYLLSQVKIAYIKDNDIYLTDEQGNTPVNLTNSTAIETTPRFSPDAIKIAYISNESGRYELWLMNADGSNKTQITNNQTTYQITPGDRPAWSADGQWIYLGSAGAGDGEVWKIKTDGTGLTQLTNVSGYNTQSFDISHDGTKACFDRGVEGNGYTNQLYTSAADFTIPVVRQASNAPHRSQFSPDGSKIVYWADTGGQIGTHIINADGTNDELITSSLHADWHPDGTKLLIMQDGNLYWISTAGTNTTLVTTGADWQASAAYVTSRINTQYALTVSIAGSGSGLVTANTGTILWSASTGTATFSAGASAILTATADSSSTFAGWIGCSSTYGNQCTVTMDAAKNVTATFTLNTYALTVTKSGSGNGTVTVDPGSLIWSGSTGTATYSMNTSVTPNAMPIAVRASPAGRAHAQAWVRARSRWMRRRA